MKNTKNTLKIKYAFIALVYCFAHYGAQAQNQLYPSNFDLTTLNGSNGFAVPGLPTSNQLGSETQFIGDINNDGLEDIVIGSGIATINGDTYTGAAYIIFGSTTAFPTPFDVNTLNGTNGFAVEGNPGKRRGNSVAGPGDINGDGIDDLIISGSYNDQIVLYGSTTTFPAVITINDINGTNGFTIDTNGSSQVASLGDVNGDNINDFIIGKSSNLSQSWIIFGRSTNFPTSIGVSWLDGTNGFRTSSFTGSTPSFKVGGAGDINNDGINDILIGNWGSPSSLPTITYLLFGRSTAFAPLVDLTSLASDGSEGFSIDNTGYIANVGPLGDINNDGIDDFFSSSNAIYGSASTLPSNPAHFPLSSLDGTKGFVLPTSFVTTSIGDVNQDNIDDFISVYDNNRAYIVFGSASGFPNPIDETTLNGTNGFFIEGLKGSNIGRSVGGNGDINGDGISDFVLGSPYTIPIQTGDAYVIFGGDHYAMPLNSGYPKTINITDTGVTMVVNGPETGTIHYAIYPSSTSTYSIDHDDILSGVGADASGDFSMNLQNTDVNKVIFSLSSNTYFKVFMFLEDAAGNKGEIYNINFSTNTLGIEDALLSGIEIYPNPTLTTINVNLPLDGATYKLTTVSGQTLQNGKLINGSNSIDVSNLSQGLYFLSIKTDHGVVTKKIVKN